MKTALRKPHAAARRMVWPIIAVTNFKMCRVCVFMVVWPKPSEVSYSLLYSGIHGDCIFSQKGEKTLTHQSLGVYHHEAMVHSTACKEHQSSVV